MVSETESDAVRAWLHGQDGETEQENAAQWLAGIGTGAASGAATGAAAGPWGAGVGALVGAGLGALQTYQAQQAPRPRPPAAPPSPHPASPAVVPAATPGGGADHAQTLQQVLALLTQLLAQSQSGRTGSGGEAAENAMSESYGLEQPVPDYDLPADLEEQVPMAFAAEYPGAARFVPAAAGNFQPWAGAAPRAIRRIVIHITDASTLNGTVRWFQDQRARVSAHYVIDRDGTVVQMVRHADVAWHARGSNTESIGIEHVAVAPTVNAAGLLPTAAQYCASAALVRWLCDTYGIAVDRANIVGHSEADPRTNHHGCPNSVWDWNYFMGMVSSGTCYAPPADARVGESDMPQRRPYHALTEWVGETAATGIEAGWLPQV
jgi:hypothetical protein